MWEKEILKEFEQRRKQTIKKEKKTDIGKLYYRMLLRERQKPKKS